MLWFSRWCSRCQSQISWQSISLNEIPWLSELGPLCTLRTESVLGTKLRGNFSKHSYYKLIHLSFFYPFVSPIKMVLKTSSKPFRIRTRNLCSAVILVITYNSVPSRCRCTTLGLRRLDPGVYMLCWRSQMRMLSTMPTKPGLRISVTGYWTYYTHGFIETVYGVDSTWWITGAKGWGSVTLSVKSLISVIDYWTYYAHKFGYILGVAW